MATSTFSGLCWTHSKFVRRRESTLPWNAFRLSHSLVSFTPSESPTPTDVPIPRPTDAPVAQPTDAPIPQPTDAPIAQPTDAPVPLQPTATPVQRVRVRDFYISFVSPDAAREPTQAEYEEMMAKTTDWFEVVFAERFANDPNVTFLGSNSAIEETKFNAGIPEARFNIYMNFEFTDVLYTEDSSPPGVAETFEIMRQAITTDYILEAVRSVTDSPFEVVTEVYFAAVE